MANLAKTQFQFKTLPPRGNIPQVRVTTYVAKRVI